MARAGVTIKLEYTDEEEEIRKERNHWFKEIAKADALRMSAQAQLRALRATCGHRLAYKTSHMGESCRDCPICDGCGV